METHKATECAAVDSSAADESPARVLLVEDDAECLEAVAAALQKRGLLVAKAANADEALAQFSAGSFDVVVADIRLCGMNGIELLASIRRQRPDFPVILLTGYEDVDSAVEALRLGADDYISKPLNNIDALLLPVRKAIRNYRVAAQNEVLCAQIQEKERLLTSILTSMDDLLFVFDPQGRFSFSHSRLTQGLLQAPDRFLGRKHSETMPAEIDRLFADAMEKNRRGESAEYEYQLEYEGKTTWWSAKLSPMFSNGEFKGSVAVVRNITERKKKEQELREDREKLRRLTMELQLAEEKERQRIAIHLHEKFVSVLTLFVRKMDELAAVSPGGPAPAGADELRELAVRAIDDARTLIYDLSPPALHKLGLESALEGLADRVRAKYDIEVRFENDGRPKHVSNQVKMILYRAVEELVLNSVKHADARAVEMAVSRQDDGVRVAVRDHGPGFTSDAKTLGTPEGGFGLFSIGERLRNVGGRLEVACIAGQGACVTMTVPLEAEEGSVGNEDQVARC